MLFKKLNKKLGWKPEYSGKKGLTKGLEKFIDWLKTSDEHTQYKEFNKYIY